MTTLLAGILLEQMIVLGYNTGVILNQIDGRSGACNTLRPDTRKAKFLMQSHSATDPYFPENLDAYAPWVSRHGLRAPYGKCQCGCGVDAPIVAKSNYSAGRKMGHPARFAHGHNAKIWDPAPDGCKTCHVCRRVKPESDFYTLGRGGLSVACKDCSRAVSKRYHHENRDERLGRIAEYRHRNKEQLAAMERERRADPAYREKCAQELKEWRSRNREHVSAYNRSLQVKARSAVNKAVLRGDLPHVTTMVCAHCEEAQAQEYHHYAGYDRGNWYKVIPLCTECHGREHRAS